MCAYGWWLQAVELQRQLQLRDLVISRLVSQADVDKVCPTKIVLHAPTKLVPVPQAGMMNQQAHQISLFCDKISLMQVVQQASWDHDSGRWCLPEPADTPRSVPSFQFDRQLPHDIVAAKSLQSSVALLATPPWALRSQPTPSGQVPKSMWLILVNVCHACDVRPQAPSAAVCRRVCFVL